MTTLVEFTIFSALPPELRLLVWKNVPQPARVICLLPCATCSRLVQIRERIGTASASGAAEDCACVRHPDWRLRWVVNSTRQTVFPPLHACREAREVWLPCYFSPPRYLDLDSERYGPEDARELGTRGVGRVRFDVPFVSYESDIFTVLNTGEAFFGVDIDPLLGFDRSRIRNIAIAENAWSLDEVIAAVQPQSLPRLGAVTVLILGPNPGPSREGQKSSNSGWQEMPPADVQLFDCDVLDVADGLIAEHPFFGRSRLSHMLYEPEPKMRQFAAYLEFFKAWLWHANRWDSSRARDTVDFDWWDFHSYVFDSAVESCPLRDLPQWCPGDHTKHQMTEEVKSLAVNTKVLVEQGCMAELISSFALRLDPTGAYEDFGRFKEDRMTRWKRH